MKFVNHTEVKRSADVVFDYLCGFEAMEERARSAGIAVERISGDGTAIAGAEWLVEGRLGGAPRKVNIRLERVSPPSSLVFKNDMRGTEVHFEVQVLAQSNQRTRLRTITDIKARSLSARLVVQSMRLVRPRINSRIDAGLIRLARRIEAEI